MNSVELRDSSVYLSAKKQILPSKLAELFLIQIYSLVERLLCSVQYKSNFNSSYEVL